MTTLKEQKKIAVMEQELKLWRQLSKQILSATELKSGHADVEETKNQVRRTLEGFEAGGHKKLLSLEEKLEKKLREMEKELKLHSLQLRSQEQQLKSQEEEIKLLKQQVNSNVSIKIFSGARSYK